MSESTVEFAPGSAALAAPERQQVVSYLLALQAGKFCPLQHILVIGYADESEGNPSRRQRLAEHRAQYVAEVLKRHGAPVSVLYAGPGDQKYDNRTWRGLWAGYVEMAAQQTVRSQPCTVAADAHGFFPDPKSKPPARQ